MAKAKMKAKLLDLKLTMNKAMLTALAVSTLAFGTSGLNATANANTELTTVYHIYIKNNFIGTIPDTTEIEELIEEKTNSLQEVYQEFDLEIGTDLSYVPEQVFPTFSTATADDVLERLEADLSVQASAAALVIDDEEVAYVKDDDAAEEVLKRLKLAHVNEQQLMQLEEEKDALSEANGNNAKEQDTKILDVRLTADVSISEGKTNPKDILSVEEAIKLFKKGTLEEKKYQVKEGDVLGSIANSHGLTLKELLSLNPQYNEESVLKPGDELVVTYHEPFTKVIVAKEVYKEEKIPFEKEVIEDEKMFKGDTKVKQEGKDGLNGVIYKVIEENGVVTKTETVETTVLQEPVKEVIIKGTKVVPSRGTGSFVWPTNGGYVSSEMGHRWGQMHKGIDIARPSDRTIKAADNGVVVSAGYDGGYGNKVVIDHQNGYRTVYAHLDSISVRSGQVVPSGSKIGVMGSTGNSTGVHLHFEVYKNGKLINPRDVL